MTNENWIKAPIWNEWGELTRLQFSGQIAFGTEIETWSDVPGNSADIFFKDGVSGADYKTSVNNHVSALGCDSIFMSLIFLRSYSLLERHSKFVRYILKNQLWSLMDGDVTSAHQDIIDNVSLSGGFDAWSEALMNDVRQPWDLVYKGKAGLNEVSIIRNALVHGRTQMAQDLLTKAANLGAALPFQVGERIRINLPLVHEYRGRIRSFCRIITDGMVHLRKGTHRDLSRMGQ